MVSSFSTTYHTVKQRGLKQYHPHVNIRSVEGLQTSFEATRLFSKSVEVIRQILDYELPRDNEFDSVTVSSPDNGSCAHS